MKESNIKTGDIQTDKQLAAYQMYSDVKDPELLGKIKWRNETEKCRHCKQPYDPKWLPFRYVEGLYYRDHRGWLVLDNTPNVRSYVCPNCGYELIREKEEFK